MKGNLIVVSILYEKHHEKLVLLDARKEEVAFYSFLSLEPARDACFASPIEVIAESSNAVTVLQC